MKVLQQKVRISLKNLESLSYNIVKPDQLKEILRLTKPTVKDLVPTDSGLILHPSCNTTVTARKVKLKYKKYKIWKASQKYSKLPKARKAGQPKLTRQCTRVEYVIDVSCS